jgi:PAS domain S-box-containing protein
MTLPAGGADLDEFDGTHPALLEALSTMGLAVMVLDDRGAGFELRYANPPAAALLGYALDELWRLPPIEIIVSDQQAAMIQLAAATRAGAPAPPILEITARCKDGTRLPVELAVSYVRGADGVRYVAIVREILAHQAHLSLLEADRVSLVGALAAGFAHEINNPLTSILLTLRSLRTQLSAAAPPSPAAILRRLDDITTEAERIAGNVRALAALASRTGAAALDLGAVVASALRLAAPTLEPRANVIRQLLPVDAITAEESRLGQAVLAMLLFSSSGFDVETSQVSNRIVVCVEQREREVVLEVSDNGSDLTAEEIRHAFDPFYRSAARATGVGVGLSVARSVAAGLGGTVTLTARPGGGAVISMRLPTTA